MEQSAVKDMKRPFHTRNRWPLILIGFFAVVFAVNAVFLYKSIETYDGLVDEDYYMKGLFYSKNMDSEKALGWKIDLSFGSTPVPESTTRVNVEIKKDGAPVDGADVAVVLKRPAMQRYDRSYRLAPAGGVYRGEIRIPLEGLWDVEIKAVKDGKEMETTFRIRV